ncbi:MAG: RNA-binding S4 domain-containing protein [Luteolibacter sp.]
MSDSVRVDKWLWATRFFKTRGLSAQQCTAGKVKRNGHSLKPAAAVQAGDVLEIPFPEGPGHKTVRVLGLIRQRVGAPLAAVNYEDLTPPETYAGHKAWTLARQEAGKGRPTKKDRRQLGRIRGFFE